MKRFILFIILFLFQTEIVFCQESYSVGFSQGVFTVKRTKLNSIYSIKLEMPVKPKEGTFSSLKIGIDPQTTLTSSEYSLSKTVFSSTELKDGPDEYELYLEIKGDTIPDRVRELIFNLKFSDPGEDIIKNIAKYQTLVVTIKPFITYEELLAKKELRSFENLAFIGTNFDLAAGKLQSKNLFFASNVLKKPKTDDNNVGVYLSIYGNRAMTLTDSSGRAEFRRNIIVTDTSYNRIRIANEVVSEVTSDNLGAYISPLIRIDKWFRASPKPSKEFSLYYAPSAEFVWRRTEEKNSYTEVGRDTTLIVGNIESELLNSPPSVITRNYNEFAFNLGVIGLFMVLENENISVRVHGSVGFTSVFTGGAFNGSRGFERSGDDIFFSGRAWITEPVTGLTLQAEVNNTLNNPRPFFIATISKAFSFKDISSIFKPIIPKTSQ